MDDKLEYRFQVFEVRQEGDRAISSRRGNALSLKGCHRGHLHRDG